MKISRGLALLLATTPLYSAFAGTDKYPLKLTFALLLSLNAIPSASYASTDFSILSVEFRKEFTQEGIKQLFAKRGPNYYETIRKARSEKVPELSRKLGMTADDLRAIQAYTGAGYREINPALRNPETLTDELRAEANRAIVAVAKTEKFRGLSYRGTCLTAPAMNKYFLPSNEITEPAFTSTDINPVLAYKFSLIGENCRRIVLMIDGFSGRDVAWVSSQTGEDEILFLPKTRFRVDFVDESADPALVGLTEI